MEPIRILQINNAMVPAGIETFIMNNYRHMDHTKIQFDFLVHYPIPQFFDEEIKQLGGKIYYLSIRKDNNLIKYFKDLNRFFKEHKEYHVIHGHLDFYGIFYLFFAWKNGLKIRLIHSHNAMVSLNIKGFINYILSRPLRYMTKYRFACSEKAGKFLYGRKPFTVLNNAVNIEQYRFNEEKRKNIRESYHVTDELVFVSVARFEKQKNHSFILSVFEEILKEKPNAKLWLIGRGPLEDNVKKEIEKRHLEKSAFILGVQSDIQGYLSASDVLLMPSFYEGLPVSGVEAQVNGIQCYFSDTITQEINVSDCAHFISLKKEPSEWAKEILDQTTDHLLYQEQSVKEHGFDIIEEAKKLQELYIELDKKGGGQG